MKNNYLRIGRGRGTGAGTRSGTGEGEGEKDDEKTAETENEGHESRTENGKIYAVEVDSKHSGPKHGRVRGSLLFENLTWLTSNEAVEYLRLPSVGALRVLVCCRKIPFHKMGRNLRFKKPELDRWLDASRMGGI